METNATEQWLNTTLKADVALAAVVSTRIYNTRRPTSAVLPCVVFQLQAAGRDMVVLGGIRVWADMMYLVRGIAEQASYEGNLAIIADRIDVALHAKSGVSAAGVVHTVVRERPFQLVSVIDGREFRDLGGLYRIQVSKA